MSNCNFFSRHLSEIGENYLEHFLFAFTTGVWLLLAGVVLVVHSIMPFIFVTTSSRYVKKINEVLQKRVEMFTTKKEVE